MNLVIKLLVFSILTIASLYEAQAADSISLPGGYSCSVLASGKTASYQKIKGKNKKIDSKATLRSFLIQIALLQKRLKNTHKSLATTRKNLNSQIATIVKKRLALAACQSGYLGMYVVDDMLGAYSGSYSGTMTYAGISSAVSGTFTAELALSTAESFRAQFIADDGLLSYIMGGSGVSYSFYPGNFTLNRAREFTLPDKSKMKIEIDSSGEISVTLKKENIPGVGLVDFTISVEPSNEPKTVEGHVRAKLSTSGAEVIDISFTLTKV